MFDSLLTRVERYYSGKFEQHGATARGVDWNSDESQRLRFSQLAKLLPAERFSLIDYGCGYGALAGYLAAEGMAFSYQGFDLSRPMISHARDAFRGWDGIAFAERDQDLATAEYALASGIFNVRFDIANDDWLSYILATIGRLDRLSTRGFAFNMLTSYSDPPKMRPDLYYGDSCFFFDHCVRNFSRNVAMLHDYGLYEFTVICSKDVSPSRELVPFGTGDFARVARIHLDHDSPYEVGALPFTRGSSKGRYIPRLSVVAFECLSGLVKLRDGLPSSHVREGLRRRQEPVTEGPSHPVVAQTRRARPRRGEIQLGGRTGPDEGRVEAEALGDKTREGVARDNGWPNDLTGPRRAAVDEIGHRARELRRVGGRDHLVGWDVEGLSAPQPS